MSGNEERKPAYWAVLPATVRYDQNLTPNAKLLYAEITALASRDGFCWAKNEYFSSLFGLDVRTIQRLIAQLEKSDYIAVETTHDGGTQRKLWVDAMPMIRAGNRQDRAEKASEKAPFWGDKNVTPPGQNCRKRGDKNVTQNNININNPPIVPPEGEPGKGAKTGKRGKTAPSWKPERFEKFWLAYPRAASNEGMKRSDAAKAWDKLKATDELLDEMAEFLRSCMSMQAWREGRGIPYASTWLNGIRKNGIELPDGLTRGPQEPPAVKMENVKGAYRL